MLDHPIARYSGVITAVSAVLMVIAFLAVNPLAAPLAVVFILAALGWALRRFDPEWAGVTPSRHADGSCRGCREGCVGCRERIDSA